MIALLFLFSQTILSGETGRQRSDFPYRTYHGKMSPSQEGFNQKIFNKRTENVPSSQIRFSEKNNPTDQRKSLMETNNSPSIPQPTSNPFMTYGQITITTGSLLSTTIATISETKTTIETSMTVGVFTQVSKYTETFTESNKTYLLTVTLVNEVVPTFTSFDKSTNTVISTRVYTLGSLVVTSHTNSNTYTEYLTYSRSTSDTYFTVSEYGVINAGGYAFGISTTSFDTDTNTKIYTQVSRTYVWTKPENSVIYTITRPFNWTTTDVKKGITVTISGPTQTSTDTFTIFKTSISYIDTLVSRSFPLATEIPKTSSVDYRGKEVIFTFTNSEVSTEVASFAPINCSTKGVISTWTMTSMYTSTFAPNLKLTMTEVFAKVLTEIEENGKCYSMTIEKVKTATNVITTTITDTIVLTETMTNTKSIFYEVQKSTTYHVWSSTMASVQTGDEFNIATMTDSRILVNSGSINTFVEAYTSTIISTTATGYTTTLTFTKSNVDQYATYKESPKETNTVTMILVRRNDHHDFAITSHSDCSNFYSNKMTSISSTVIYTYSEYLTLVQFVNDENQSTTLYALGTPTSYSSISVNLIGSTVKTDVSTVTSTAGTAVVGPSSTIFNSLISTYIYTAVYVSDSTLFSVFEDHCVFKKFTNTETYSTFPTIAESNYNSVTETKISNMDLTQTSVPLTYTIYTYGYTILDKTPTYILADFSTFTMTNTFVQAGNTPTNILSTVSVKEKTATGISTFSKTIIEYIPIRTPFPTFSEELINPYYTMANLTFTTTKEVSTISSTIYQRPTNYTTSTLTNIMTSTVLFTETFYSSGNTITFGYSTMNVLVPTEVNIKSNTETIFLTYHSIGTNYLTATHHVTETLTQALTFHTEKLEEPKEVNVSSYTEVVTSFCYQSFTVSSPTSAYVYTQIYKTWLWTKIEESVVYTVTEFSDYIYTKVSGNGATAYVATYSCVGSTSYYSNTESLSSVKELTTYASIEYPVPSPIPTEEKIVEEVIKTYIATNAYASSVNTYMTTLSKVNCTEDIMTVTLTDTMTFKKTFTQSDKDIIEMYTQASTIAYTLTQILANGDGCNTYIISKVTTDTQVFTNTEVAVKENDMFKETITSFTVSYTKASKVMKKSALTNSMIVLTVGASSKITTYSYSDISTFVQASDLMTYVETYTRTPVTTELSGPTSALVLTEKETEAYPEYSPINSFSEAFSMVYTQKPPQEMEIPHVQNPCISFGTKQSVTNLQTYIETFSEYSFLVTFKNTGDSATTVLIGTIAESAFTMAAFFSTTTVVSTSTVVKQGNSAVVNPSSVITNFITSTFTLTQVYVDGPTAYTEFEDICVVYGITMKDTTIMMPVEVKTQIPTLTDTNIAVTRPTDIEYITYARQREYREGLTMFGNTPTRTFSLFDTFTYTSDFFKGDFARVKSLTYSEGNTVIENAVKTNTIVIAEPPKADPSDNNLLYIIIGVVIGVIVIAAVIVVALLFVRKKDIFIDEFQMSLLEDDYTEKENGIRSSYDKETEACVYATNHEFSDCLI